MLDKIHWIKRGKEELTAVGATPDQCYIWADKLYSASLKEVTKAVNLIMFYRYIGNLAKYIQGLKAPPAH